MSRYCFYLTLSTWLHIILTITGKEKKLFISVFKSPGERSHTGLLLLSLGKFYNHTQDGTVCGLNTGETGLESVELTPAQTSADVLCKFANLNGVGATNTTNKYERAEWVRVAGGGYYVDHQFFTAGWSKDLKPSLADLTCLKDTSASPHRYSCSHRKYNSTVDNCEGDYTNMIAISCGCHPNFYRTDEGCFQCPCNSQSDGFLSRCECNPGYYYNDTLSSCARCEEGTYSLQNSTYCAPSSNGTFGGLDGGEASDACEFTCRYRHVKVGGTCMSNSVLGVIVLVVVLVFLGALVAWRGYRFKATVLRRNCTSRGSSKPRVVVNRATEESEPQSDQHV
ncbi:hypothetical protein ACHWQZ_G007202 [Mnemiopsis leidyi]